MDIEIFTKFEKQIKDNDPLILEDFRQIVLNNNIELIHAIWDKFPNYVWPCISGHLFEDLSWRGMYDMIDMFIKHDKLWGGAIGFAEEYRKDPTKWKNRYNSS